MVMLGTTVAAALFAVAQVGAPGEKCDPAADKIKYAMYFLSKPQDAAECSMSVRAGQIAVAPAISNPALTCPDLFTWKLFAEVVKQEFWKDWAADQHTWPGVQCPNGDKHCPPSDPLPLCRAPGADPKRCCDPDRRDNPGYDDSRYPAKFCPYFPGDHLPAGPALRIGAPLSKAHQPAFALEAARDPQKRELLRLKSPNEIEPGREIRQSMAELVFRNKPMFDYTFRNDLYNQEGIVAVFDRNGRGVSGSGGAPYRLRSEPGALAEIDYPVASVMIKSNWVSKERAPHLGLKEDPAHPYIRMEILSPVTDNNGTILKPGEHWLVAFHVSSKDTPNWVWASFEHVNNPGRCDYTGCNDAYGYATPDAAPFEAKLSTNYTSPKLKCDALPLASWVFDPGRTYGGGKVSPGLEAVLDALEIGTRDNHTLVPTPRDRGWRSYRLKGSQTQFTDSMGRATNLGNSVTEGGFVTTSSCIGCHARAGTGPNGTVPPPLGVFVNQLSETGYQQSHSGSPVADWYHRSGQPPPTILTVLQTDFVWGFLAANWIKPPGRTPPSSIRSRR